MPKVSYIANKLRAGKAWDVEGMLEQELDNIKKGISCNKGKAILIYLDNDSKKTYDYAWAQAGMDAEELVALLRIVAHDFEHQLVKSLHEVY